MRLSSLLIGCVVTAGLISAEGCVSEQAQGDPLVEELRQTRQAVRELTERNEALQSELQALQRQIESLQTLGDKRLERLFYVRRIELGRHTGGVNLDQVEGDDAVKVYLKTIDQDGSVIKAAGDVKIELFDLAAEPQDNLIGRYEWPVEEMSKHWTGGFANNFSFDCPWDAAKGPPRHDEIAVRAEFTDYLTGRVFSAQKLCKISLPAPSPAAGTQPAK